MRKGVQFSFSVFQDQNRSLSANRVSMAHRDPACQRQATYYEDRSVQPLNEFACEKGQPDKCLV